MSDGYNKMDPAGNHYTLAELQTGMEASFTAAVTEEKVRKFLEVSGDTNPLHMDDEYARAKGHPGRVVYGMLTASLYSTLAGVYLPGEHCFLWEVDSKFTGPVYIGDVLTVSGKVTEVNERFRFIKIKARIDNQNGQTVSRAVITTGVDDGT